MRQLGRGAEAIALCEQELPPESEEKAYLDRDDLRQQVKLTLGILYYENGNIQQAEQTFKRCLYVGTERKQAVTETALAYLKKCSLRRKNYAAAEEWNDRLRYLCPQWFWEGRN